jgi:hypothetical protein
VSGVEFEGQRGWAGDTGHLLPACRSASPAHQGSALACPGDTAAARAAADASLESASEFGGVSTSVGYFALANMALAAGDIETALDATAAAWEHGSFAPGFAAHLRPVIVHVTLAGGDLIAARRWADDAVAMSKGWAVLMRALTVRACVAIAQGEPEQAERDAHDALASTPKVSIWAFPTPLSASPRWPAALAVTAKRRGCSARQRPSASAWAWCGSRSETPTVTRR